MALACEGEDGGWIHIIVHHVPGGTDEAAALALMSVPPQGRDFADLVRHRARTVGSVLLGTRKAGARLARCCRCHKSVVEAEAPGGLCEECIEEVAAEILDEIMQDGGISGEWGQHEGIGAAEGGIGGSEEGGAREEDRAGGQEGAAVLGRTALF